ncbi:40026_t:CDS:2, partial [Gigaspora margarita]
AGNAGYGIITALTLRIYPIPKIVTRLSIEYDFDQTPLLFSVLDQLGPNFHQNLTTYILINSDSGLSTNIHCIYLGSADELRHHVDVQEFIKLSKPKNVTYIENDLYHIEVTGELLAHGYFKSLTFFFDQKGIPFEGLKYLMKFMKSFKCVVHSETLLIAGGKINEIGLFSRIGKLFPQNYASYECYQNLIDRQLDNWQCRYYAENFKRLVEIKQKYDPYNLFRWNQSIPTTTNIS